MREQRATALRNTIVVEEPGYMMQVAGWRPQVNLRKFADDHMLQQCADNDTAAAGAL